MRKLKPDLVAFLFLLFFNPQDAKGLTDGNALREILSSFEFQKIKVDESGFYDGFSIG